MHLEHVRGEGSVEHHVESKELEAAAAVGRHVGGGGLWMRGGKEEEVWVSMARARGGNGRPRRQPSGQRMAIRCQRECQLCQLRCQRQLRSPLGCPTLVVIT